MQIPILLIYQLNNKTVYITMGLPIVGCEPFYYFYQSSNEMTATTKENYILTMSQMKTNVKDSTLLIRIEIIVSGTLD